MSRSSLAGLNISASEREFVKLGVKLDTRGDGRGRLDYRTLSVQAGVLAQVKLATCYKSRARASYAMPSSCGVNDNKLMLS